MAGYLDRLVQRARPDLGAVQQPLPAPAARHSVTTHDPFDAEPLVTPATWPSQQRSHERTPTPIVADALRTPGSEPVPAPLRSAEDRVVVEREQHVERERVIEHMPVTLEPEPARERSAPPAVIERRLESQVEKTIVEHDVATPALIEPTTLIQRDITREVTRSLLQTRSESEATPPDPRDQVQLLQPSAAPVLTPSMQPMPIAREQVEPRRDSPRLVIGQLVVEVTPRAPAPAPVVSAPAPQVVVVRSPSTPTASVFHRGFGLGQS